MLKKEIYYLDSESFIEEIYIKPLEYDTVYIKLKNLKKSFTLEISEFFQIIENLGQTAETLDSDLMKYEELVHKIGYNSMVEGAEKKIKEKKS